jgi:DNA-binding NarL/FixJ family response regulator
VIGVLTVDDHVPFLEVARELIAATPGFRPLREVTSGSEAIAAADELEPELVLLDVHLPGMSGVDVSREITAHHPETTVILISTDAPDELPSAARACGATTIARKQDLRPETLQRLWRDHRASDPG